MERWARSKLGDTAVFLSVCVEGPGVAQAFASAYGLRKSVCAYLEQSDSLGFPAQLGCQGFVVVDAHGKFLSIATRKWTEEREAAFYDVERLLPKNNNDDAGGEAKGEAQQQTRKKRVMNDGSRVRLAGLARRTDMNGVEGVVVGEVGALLSIKLDRDGLIVNANPQNLLRVGPLTDVFHSKMDADHADIVQKIERLYQDLSFESLAALRDAFATHAIDEERLLKAQRRTISSEGKEDSAFSALGSHVADHARILDLADAALSGDAPSLDKVRLLAYAIYDHADTFDAHYAGTLDDISTS